MPTYALPAFASSYKMGSGCHNYSTCIILAYASSTLIPWQAAKKALAKIAARKTASFEDNTCMRICAHAPSITLHGLCCHTHP